MGNREGPLHSKSHPGYVTGEELKQISDELESRYKLVGKEGNAWYNEQTGENGFSKKIDLRSHAHFAIMGVVDGDTTINVYLSQDGINFYYSSKITDNLQLDTFPDVPVWDKSTNYDEGDMVEYTIDDVVNIYTAIRDNRNKEPTNERYWELSHEDVEDSYPHVFSTGETTAARYIQLQSTNDVLATVTIVAKP